MCASSVVARVAHGRAQDGRGEDISEWNFDYSDCTQGIQYPPVAGNAILFYSQNAGAVSPLRPATQQMYVCMPKLAADSFVHTRMHALVRG
eukprot:COSAG05_NODE_520_length_9047_cov_2.500224_6_plen_91_part_00